MPYIDLNCDMGEGMTTDAEIMPYISSVNIACGYHAGDKDTMRRTVECALKHNVAIGAHPSYEDLKNFGRLDLLGSSVQYEDLFAIVSDQVTALLEICGEMGAVLHHAKLHGALYNRAAKDKQAADILSNTIKEIDESLFIYGLSGSEMMHSAQQTGMRFISEVFADRSYQDDGSLTPRTSSNALIDDQSTAIRQVLQMIKEKKVTAVSGKPVPILAESVCIHGDGPHALTFAKSIHQALIENRISIHAP